MEIDEADNIYSGEVSRANEFFVKGLKENKDKNKLEKQYKEKLKESRKRYQNLIVKILKSKRGKKEIKKEEEQKDSEKENKKKYKRKAWLNIRIKASMFYFKFKIRLKEMMRGIVPDNFRYRIKKSRSNVKLKIKRTKEHFFNIKSDFQEFVKNLIEKVQKITTDFVEKTKIKYNKYKEVLKTKFKKKEIKKEDQPTLDNSQKPGP